MVKRVSKAVSTPKPTIALGDRMKRQYEDRTRYFLPRRTFTIVRVDGKAFHSYTRHCERPFDVRLMEDMDLTALALCRDIQGAQLAYVQSDEISVLLTDFATITTDAWFDGNLQKIVSIAASVATVEFNALRLAEGRALFDARAFTIPDRTEAMNYLIWRQQDATRNSLQMAAQAVYSHREMHGRSTKDMHEMLHAKGINWDAYPVGCKRGRVIEYIASEDDLERGWRVTEPPIFTQERTFLDMRVPRYEPLLVAGEHEEPQHDAQDAGDSATAS